MRFEGYGWLDIRDRMNEIETFPVPPPYQRADQVNRSNPYPKIIMEITELHPLVIE